VDVLVSEWMGYFLIYENMLNSVLIAKDKFLKEGGIMIPGNCRLFLAPYDSSENAKHQTEFQADSKALTNYCTSSIDVASLLGDEEVIFEIDMNKAKEFDNKFKKSFSMKVVKDGEVGGFVSWFIVEMIKGSFLSTSPKGPGTHWEQQLFKIQNPFQVKAGQVITGHIDCKPQPLNNRALDLEIGVLDPVTGNTKKETFKMD
jgi:protein arginine N-methyltransferase 1